MDILDRTPKDGKALCLGCKLVQIRRTRDGEVMMHCGHFIPARRVTAVIEHCTVFYPADEPWLHEHEQLAWLWCSDKDGNPAFIRLRDYREDVFAPAPAIGFKVR